MRNLACLLVFCLLACQPREANDAPDRQDAIVQKAERSNKNNVPEAPRKKITFKDIKGRFRHTEARQEPVPKDTVFYRNVRHTGASSLPKHILTQDDLIDLGIEDVCKASNDCRHMESGIYAAYSLRKIGAYYLVGIAQGGEMGVVIRYFWADEERLLKHCFSFHAGGDVGFLRTDFAYFEATSAQVHSLEIAGVNAAFSYKKYKISFLPNLQTQTDTLSRQVIPNTEKIQEKYDLFEQIRQQHGYKY